MSETKPICAVVGVGPGNGEAFARRFSRDGYRVALLARSPELSARLAAELPDAKAYPCDVGDEASVAGAFAAIRADMGEVDVMIYNAGAGAWGTIEAVSVADFERSWRVNTLGLFLTGREVIGAMKAKGAGAIIVVGATASLRGVAGTAAFAPAKAGQRALAQSMARHLGPSGVHVSLLVVDGVVGGPVTRSRYGERPEEAYMNPEAIADTAMALVRQDRSAWTFELDLRPFGEKW